MTSVLDSCSPVAWSCVFQETREKVKLLLHLADSLVEKGHAHAASIKSWVAAVDKRYKDFSSRMEKYRMRLESTLGLSHDSGVR